MANDLSDEIKIIQELSSRYGELIGGDRLRHVLGFPTLASLKQALRRKTLTLPTFFIEGRRGRFALTSDVARWLIKTKNNGAVERKAYPSNNI